MEKGRDYKRSIETLVREYPKLTGAEILKLRNEDERLFKIWQEHSLKEQYETIKWLLESRYIKIEYPTMISYLEITSASVEHGDVYFDSIQSIISKNSAASLGNGFNLSTFRESKYQQWYNHYSGLEKLTVLTKEEYDLFHQLVENLYNH